LVEEYFMAILLALVLCNQQGNECTHNSANVPSEEDECEEEQEGRLSQQGDHGTTLLPCLWCSRDFDERGCRGGREGHGLLHQESILVDRPIGGRDGGGGGVGSVRAFRGGELLLVGGSRLLALPTSMVSVSLQVLGDVEVGGNAEPHHQRC